MIAVVPSGPAALGLAPFSASRRKTVGRSPDSAASNNVVAGAAIETAAVKTAASATTDLTTLRILDLRKNAAAVADRLHRNIVPVEDGLQQIGKARVLRILQVLPAFDAPVSMAEQGRRQRI